MFIQYNDGVEVHDSTSTQVWGNSEDSDCADEKEKVENAGKCPSSCQKNIDCLIASCSDCAVVDVVCDEEIDTAAYPHLARQATDEDGNPQKYSDLDLADVPAEKRIRAPYGDSGLFETMSIWTPEGCRYPYYGFMPDEPLCSDCSSMYQAKEEVLHGMWDGPCNGGDPPGDDDSLPLPSGYPGCGCDCAEFLRRPLSTCTDSSCVNVAQNYASSNSVCDGSEVKWNTTAAACATYGDADKSFDSTWVGSDGSCIDDDGNVQAASETCYQTASSTDEGSLTDKKANLKKQCAFNAASATTPVALTLALAGAMVLA